MKTSFRGIMELLGDPQRPVPRVVLSGAAGGALGVMAGALLGELSGAWYQIIVPSVALGAGAAFAAVFVLLGIKTEDVHRCCGVALLAGFFWQPVFAAGKDYLLNSEERETEKRVVQTTEELDQVTANLRKSPTNAELVAQAGTLAQNLTRETADLRRGGVKSRTQASIAQSLDVLAISAEKQPPVAAGALLNVAETAIRTGNRTVADKARVQVERVPLTSNTELQARKLKIMSLPQ